MLFELSIIPLRGDSHLSTEIAEAFRIIDGSGLPYRLTPTCTCIEGEWDEVMSVIKDCHESIKERSNHVITTIKIEDEEGERNKLVTNVESVVSKARKS